MAKSTKNRLNSQEKPNFPISRTARAKLRVKNLSKTPSAYCAVVQIRKLNKSNQKLEIAEKQQKLKPNEC